MSSLEQDDEDIDWWSDVKPNDTKSISLIVLGTFSSTLSILGSSCIIYIMTTNNTQESCLKTRIMYRLLFALSISDVIASISFLLTPFLIPSYMGVPGSSLGSHTSCTVIGFLWLMGVPIGMFYNCYLSLYYLLVVKWSYKERDFIKRRRYEILAHATAVLVPLSINTAAAATQSINPAPVHNSLCMFSAIPWGCEGVDEDLVCTRSSPSTVKILLVVGTIVQLILPLISFGCTYWVWKTVATTIRRSSAHRFAGDQDDNNNQRLKQVSTQAVLYSFAYLNTFLWPIFTLMIPPDHHLEDRGSKIGYYILAMMFTIFYPLQGAMNFFYFCKIKSPCMDESCWIRLSNTTMDLLASFTIETTNINFNNTFLVTNHNTTKQKQKSSSWQQKSHSYYY